MQQNKILIVSRMFIFIVTFLYASLLFAGSVTLSWAPPKTNANGSALTDLDGYRIYYGNSSRNYSQFIDVGQVTRYTVDDLPAGLPYYFAVSAYDISGNESVYSHEISKAPDFFLDNFNTDSTGEYTITDTWTVGGRGEIYYDGAGKRLKLMTGDDIALQFSRDLVPGACGTFSIDVLPVKKYPSGGEVHVRLVESPDNFYEIYNTDGYGAGYVQKVVNGVAVEQVDFLNEYSQNSNYRISITFSPDRTTVRGFGDNLVLNSHPGTIMIDSVEVETSQQDAYYDYVLHVRDESTCISY